MVYFTFLSEIWSKNQFHRVWSEVYSMDLLPLAARCCKRNSSFKIRTGDVRPHRGGKKYQKKTGSRVRLTGNVTGRGSSSSTTLPIHCQAAIRRCSSATRRHRSPAAVAARTAHSRSVRCDSEASALAPWQVNLTAELPVTRNAINSSLESQSRITYKPGLAGRTRHRYELGTSGLALPVRSLHLRHFFALNRKCDNHCDWRQKIIRNSAAKSGRWDVSIPSFLAAFRLYFFESFVILSI